MSPVGVVGALGVFGARVAGVISALSPSAARCGAACALRDRAGVVSTPSSDVEKAVFSDMGPRRARAIPVRVSRVQFVRLAIH